MRLAFLVPGDLVKYSLAPRVLRLAEYTRIPDLEIFVLAEASDATISPPSDVRVLEYGRGSRLTKSLRMWSAIRPFRFDVLHAIKPTNAFLAALMYKWWGNSRAQIIVDYDEWESKVQPWPKSLLIWCLEWLSLRWSSRILVISRYLFEQLNRRAPGKVTYLPQGADLALFEGPDRSDQYKLADKLIISYLGFIHRRYQIEDLFLMFHLLHKRNPNTVLYIIGDGPARAELEAKVATYPWAGSVRFWGFVPREEIPHLLRASDALLFPITDSVVNRARCPTKVLEYLAADRPVVTNRVGECVHILGEEAFYYDHNSAEDFARTVARCLSLTGFRYSEERRLQNSWYARARVYGEVLAEQLRLRSSAPE
jgi:glycosyltransferase involved in cell wall biosynthesis